MIRLSLPLLRRRPDRPHRWRPHPLTRALESLVQDLDYAWRGLRRRPAFAAVAVSTLAVGIAANTTMFSVVSGVLLDDLPYPEPDRLVLIRVSVEGIESLPSVSPPELLDIRDRTGVFEGVAAVRDASATLTGPHDPIQLQMGVVTEDFFSVLGIRPLVGRDLSRADASEGRPRGVILSYERWQQLFGGDRGAVGRALRLDGDLATLVGVLPPGFQLLLPREAGLPTAVDAWWSFGFDFREAPRFRWIRAIGRLRPGVSHVDAQRAMDALAADLARQHREYREQRHAYQVVPLHSDLVRTVRAPLLLLFGAVAFVLLIACANVANLLLARSSEREPEICTRAALGASRTRIVRQLLTEGVLLAGLGAVVALALARLALLFLLRLAPQSLPRLESVRLDLRVLLFTLGISLLTVLLSTALPAVQASRANLAEALKGGLRVVGSVERSRMRQWLVTGEIALSLVLLLGAGLMIRSFVALQRVRPGFDPDRLLTLEVALPFQRYGAPEAVSRFFRELARRVQALPGVEGVGGAFPLPLSGRFWTNAYAPEGPVAVDWGSLESDHHVVLPGYFRAIGASLVRGREFTWADDLERRKVVVVDETLARKAWPGEDPIGKHVTILLANDVRQEMEVIGVVEHIRQQHPSLEGREQTYVSLSQWPQWTLPLTVRSRLPAEQVLGAVASELQRLDPALAVFKPRIMRAYLGEVLAHHRFAMTLMAVFAGVAVLLASVGLYGTIAYSVSQRSHEIGIRLALGADPGRLVLEVVGQGMRLASLGLALGVITSLGLTRLLGALLYGIRPIDLPTCSGITLLLVLVVLLACYLPARRAALVQPMSVLRYE